MTNLVFRQVLAAILVAALVIWLVVILVDGISGYDVGRLRKVCAAHQGVAQVAAPPLPLDDRIVVCRDGWVGQP